MMSGAAMVVEALKDVGVTHLFGYPGGAVLDIYDALFAQERKSRGHDDDDDVDMEDISAIEARYENYFKQYYGTVLWVYLRWLPSRTEQDQSLMRLQRLPKMEHIV